MANAIASQVQALYVGYLGRAADQAGLDFWTNAIANGTSTIESVALGFTLSQEYTSKYEGLSNEELVAAIYQNVLGRAADADGLAFWVGELEKGVQTPETLLAAMINSLGEIDQKVIDNKVLVANAFTTAAGENYDAAAGAKVLVGVDGTEASVEAALATIPGATFTLTAGSEAVNEGEAVTFTIANGQPNTEYVYKVTGVQAADIAEDAIAIVTTDENGAATITINVAADALTEGEQTLNLAIVGEEATASVTVVDASVNTAPVVTAEQVFDVAENAKEGAVVGAVAASDADGDDFTYTITTGNEAGYFAIDEATGEVTLTAEGAAALDAEAEVTRYDLGVVVVDSKGATSAEQAVTVNVTDVNDNAPVLEAFETASVEENTAAGAVVATAVATDADASDTLAYAITQGNDDGLFAIDAETGKVTLAADAPSFEDGTTQFTLKVEASDGTNAVAQDLTVNLTDVNEAPVITIADTETGSVDQSKDNVDNTANSALTATATVVDQDNNFNGGSVTLAVDGAFIYNAANSAVAFDGTNFTLIGNQLVADASVIDGDADLVIGTIDYGTQTDLDTSSADTVEGGADQITISFNQDAVNSGTVQQLLRDIRINDISTPDDSTYGAKTQAPVTVTVTDAEGLSDSFTRLVDATGAMTLTGLDGDAAEVEADGVSSQNVAIDVDGDSELAVNGAQIEGATITVTSAVAGDALHFDNTTQNIGADGTARLIGDQLALTTDGTTETLIGTVTGAGTNSMTITLNAAASTGDITNILNSIQVDLDESVLGEHAISTTISDGLGLETQNATSTFTVVADFVDATAADGTSLGGATADAALNLDALLTAIAAAPVAINGNTYVSVDNTNYSALDIDQLIADGALTVADGAIIRFVTADAADLQGVTGLNSLGTLSFGTAATPLDKNLTITAVQANGASGVVDNATVTVNGVADVLDVDLSGFSGGTLNANAALTEAATFTGDLGDFALDVTGAFPLTVAADVADGKDIDHESTDAAGDIVVTGVDSNFAGNLSDVNTDGGDVVVEFTQDTTLNAKANLATPKLAATVANNTTLTLSTEQATAIKTGGGTITGVDAVGDGNTGGSIVVTVVDSDAGTDGVQVADLDLSGLEAGGIAPGATSATAGQVSLDFTTDTTLTGTEANFGTANVTVASGATLFGTAAQLTGATISGAGSVAVAELEKTLDADLSRITVTGERTANVANDVTFAGNFGTFTVSVAADATLTTTAAIASGVAIAGDATTDEVAEGGDTAVDQVGGSIAITDLDGEAVYDLSNITAGADGDGAGDDTAGTVTATISADTTVTLDAATNLGNATLLLEKTTADGNDLIVNATAAQVDGRIVTGTANDELLVVDLDGASAALDLSNVEASVDLEASVSESIDLTGMNLGDLSAITAQDGDADVQSAINVTMTALQADAIGGEVLTAGTLDNNTLDDDTVSVTVNAATAVDGNGDAFAVGGTGVSYTGSVGNDTLNGTQAIDTIVGGDGNDVINGGTGADSITGGAGADTLDGGAGEDTFIYTAVADSGVGAGNRDIINNFEDANLTGGDVIDLSAIAGVEDSTNGDQIIDWLGTDAFTATGANTFEARYAVSGDNAIVEIDTTGDGAADMQIELTGVTQLTAGDFNLTVA